MNIPVNFLALLVAGIASMAVGFLWYSPILFAKPWMKLMGHTEKSMKAAQKQMGMMYALSFVLSLVTAYVLVHVMTMSVAYFKYDRMSAGLNSAFWMWAGFIMPVQATDIIFGGRSWKLWAINTGYQLASLVVMAIVLSVM